MESEVFQKVLEKNKNRRPILKNSLKAFLFGGSPHLQMGI